MFLHENIQQNFLFCLRVTANSLGWHNGRSPQNTYTNTAPNQIQCSLKVSQLKYTTISCIKNGWVPLCSNPNLLKSNLKPLVFNFLFLGN